MNTIALNKSFTLQEAITTSSATILRRIDDGVSVSADVMIGEVNKGGIITNKILWDANTTPSYTDVGNWTEEQFISTITNILNQ